MRYPTPRAVVLATVLATVTLASSGLAQYREYYVRGRVVDAQKKPVSDVEVSLLDPATSRRFQMKTDAKGEFKFAGLPHANYEVTFAREGFVTGKDTWKFDAPQERMQKVDVPDVVLTSQSQAQEVQRFQGAKAGVEEAAAKLQKGDFDGAISAVQKVLEKSPQEPNALFYLGLAYVGKKMYAEAVVPLTRVTELSPAFPGAHFELGVCYRQLHDAGKALAAFEKSLEIDPKNADGAYNAGLILFEQNRIDEALARFDQGLASKPQDPDLLEMAGRCYIHEGKLDLALQSLEKARTASADADKAAFLDQLIAKLRAQTKGTGPAGLPNP
ncbi:MAG TPA: tetratricopeptide repeat protein [Vicinamibacteria bacterium]|nr:tetratricopeptide repeat protein [Vicinamibacteria bacterium]